MLSRPRLSPLLPGLALAGLVTATAYGLAALETRLLGRAWLEALVLAILLGTLLRSLAPNGARWSAGAGFAAKLPLEIAVVLLGASLGLGTVLAAGPGLLAGIAGVVAVAIGASFLIGRGLGLSPRLALLVACGNSICGNSAIAAVAPVIEADGEEVGAAIAFTAVLGIGVVLGLPLLGLALGMSPLAYGAFAGLTVYAVPQVIAAATPLGAAAVQMGVLVKLVRVALLGPVCLVLALLAPRLGEGVSAGAKAPRRPRIGQVLPWFVLGFLALVACRALGLVPAALLPWIGQVAGVLTVFAMAGLGLLTDVRAFARAGGRVTAAVVLSLAGLGAVSLGLLLLLGLLG